MTVFVDTSAFMAVLNSDDQQHEAARVIWESLITLREMLVCNNYVLVETFALLQHRFGPEAVRAFQEAVIPLVSITWLDENDHAQAVSALLAARRRRLSLVDCSAMQTMRVNGIRQVFAFDRHFTEYGFSSLSAPL